MWSGEKMGFLVVMSLPRTVLSSLASISLLDIDISIAINYNLSY